MDKCACAGRTAWREAEGVAPGGSARPCARQKLPIPSLRGLVEKAGGERHGPALGAGAKGAIPLARDLTSQWEARGGGFDARASAPGITEEARWSDVTWGGGDGLRRRENTQRGS